MKTVGATRFALLAGVAVSLVLPSGVASATSYGAEGKIAVVQWEDSEEREGFDIALYDRDGLYRRPFLVRKNADFAPAWSPDGRKLLFISGGTIRVISLNGSRERVVATRQERDGNTYWPWGAAWSPDGTRIVYSMCRATWAVFYYTECSVVVANADGSAPKTIVDRSLGDQDPAWSPDGKWIAFSRFYQVDPPAARIVRVRPDGSDPVEFSDNYQTDFYPEWMPNGEIAFISGPPSCISTRFTGCWSMMMMNADGSEREVIEQGGVTDWDGDGNSEYFSSVDPSPDGSEVLTINGIGQLWSFDVKSRTARLITNAVVSPSSAAWQPRCTVRGTRRDDRLVGTPGRDLICGLGGDDVIRGRGGDDSIFGHAGADRINGGKGRDIVVGNGGRDRCAQDKRDNSRVC